MIWLQTSQNTIQTLSDTLQTYPDTVREVMDLPYLQTVLAVVTSLGVQLVEPFYTNTISTISTHSSLKKFFISLYESMEDNLKKDFFTFANPVFRGVDWELFEGVKASYKEEVLCVVSRVANEHKEEASEQFVQGRDETTASMRRGFHHSIQLSPRQPTSIRPQCTTWLLSEPVARSITGSREHTAFLQ